MNIRYDAVRWLRVLLISGIVVPFGFLALKSWQMHDAAVRQVDLRVTSTVRLLGEQVTRVMQNDQLAIALVDNVLGSLTWDEIAKSERLHSQLIDIGKSLPSIISIVVMNPDDIVANSSRDPPWPRMGDQPWIVALHDLKASKLAISPIYIGRLSKFSMAQRRSSADGQYNGLIVVSDTPHFSAISDAIPPHERISLALDTGGFLVSYPSGVLKQIPSELIQQLDHEEIVKFPNGALMRVRGFPLVVSFSVDSSVVSDLWETDVMFDTLIVLLGAGFVVFTCIIALRSYARESATNIQLQLEIERRETEVKIAYSRRLKALGQLTAGVAHDFNNLLAVVIGNAEQITHDEKSQTNANNILTAAQRGATLVAQMLTFARRQVIQTRPYEVVAGLQQIAPQITSTLKPTVKLMLIPGSAMICYVDANEFELAVLNIATNADQAMPDGGKLTMQTDTVMNDAADLLPGRYARIAFEDTGEGMTDEVKERVFEPFFTTRGFCSGTGLGLSQVYGFVKQAGGDVSIESRVGRGTKVKLYLPMYEPETSIKAETPRSLIVVVDDQEDILSIVGPALESHGYEVFCTQEPSQALTYMDKHDCSMLLTDVVMPSMSGTDLAKRALRGHPQIKVLLMTGFASDVRNYPVIRKPFRMNELLGRIQVLLQDRQDRWTQT